MTKICLMNGSRKYCMKETNCTRWSTNCWECTWTVCNERLQTESHVTSLLLFWYIPMFSKFEPECIHYIYLLCRYSSTFFNSLRLWYLAALVFSKQVTQLSHQFTCHRKRNFLWKNKTETVRIPSHFFLVLVDTRIFFDLKITRQTVWHNRSEVGQWLKKPNA